MKIYSYDENTFEFVEELEAYEDPVASKRLGEPVYMLPAHATFKKPDECKAQEIPIFNEVLNAWEIKEDFRKMYQVSDDFSPQVITKIGPLPEGFILITKEQAEKIQEDPLYYNIKNGKLVRNSKYKAEKLQQAKELKLAEASEEALNYIETGVAYRIDDENSIEATDGNIGKLTAHALNVLFGTGEEVIWTTKEDHVITLGKEKLIEVLQGMGAVQSRVWNVQYAEFVARIEAAETVKEVESIVIDYSERME